MMKEGTRLPFWLPSVLILVCLLALGSVLRAGPQAPTRATANGVLLAAATTAEESVALAPLDSELASPNPTAPATASPTATGQAAPAPTVNPTPQPAAAPAVAQSQGARGGARPALHIGIQAGHWQASQLPDELASLRTSTGAAGADWREQDVNLDIARRVAAILTADGFKVDLLPSTIPVGYQADAFVALHCDGNSSTAAHGYKTARSSRSAIPGRDDALVAALNDAYGRLTGLRLDNSTITNNMRYYYAFGGGNIQHAIAGSTPGAILEMGFLTNRDDRALLLSSPDLVAQAIVAGLEQYFGS
jgi:hypothetical protein